MLRWLLPCCVALAVLAPVAHGASSPVARAAVADVVVQSGAKAPRGLAPALRRKAKALRRAGVPTKFLVLRTLPRKPVAYSAVVRRQLRARTGEDPNVIIYWPRAIFVAFDARVPDAQEEDDAWRRVRAMRSPTRLLTRLAQILADNDPVSGGSQPRRGPITIDGPQGPITATPCVGGAIIDDIGKCSARTSDLTFADLPFDLFLRVRVVATCQPGLGPYQVTVTRPSGFDEGFSNPSPTVCGTGAASEERVFEFTASLGPARTGRNATWGLAVDMAPVAESALQIRRFNYTPASARFISQRRDPDDFFNVCLDGKHTLRSSGGVLYCYDFLAASGEVIVSTG